MFLSPDTRVCVTGASGFVASWLVRELLERGLTVRGTVRRVSSAPHLQSLPGAAERLELVEADLLAPASFDAAVQGCGTVFHTASPYVIQVDDPQRDLIHPAVNGTRGVLQACAKAKDVRRVVLTSSMAAVTDEPDASRVLTEEDWNEKSTLRRNPYYLSKTLAERAAWAFMKAEGGATELVTILPSAVFGPVLSREGLGSVQFIQRLVDGRLPRIPNVGLNIIDVRDLGVAHADAMTAPQAAGQRLIINGDFMWMKEVADTLRQRLGSRGAKIPTQGLPDFVVKLGAPFSPALNALKPLLRRSHRFLSDKARRTIGLKTRPAAETVTDCAESLLAAPAG